MNCLKEVVIECDGSLQRSKRRLKIFACRPESSLSQSLQHASLKIPALSRHSASNCQPLIIIFRFPLKFDPLGVSTRAQQCMMAVNQKLDKIQYFRSGAAFPGYFVIQNAENRCQSDRPAKVIFDYRRSSSSTCRLKTNLRPFRRCFVADFLNLERFLDRHIT